MDFVEGIEASRTRAIHKLVSLLVDESRLSKGIHRSEVKSLKDELQSIRLFLRQADARTSKKEELSEEVKILVEQSKEVAVLIEDVVEEYILTASQLQQREFVTFLGRVGGLVLTLMTHHGLSSDVIQNIITLLHQIQERGRRSTATVVGYEYPSEKPISLESSVGIDFTANELIQRLVEGASRLSVVQLVGIGGVGKTTLAKKVFHSEVVRGHFDFYAWITVTQPCNIVDQLRILEKQFCPDVDMIDMDVDMIDMVDWHDSLSSYLWSKRYLLVFDDVWEEQFWKYIEYVLPDVEVGSRIMITTRNSTVADSCMQSPFYHIHRVEPLSEASSWDLFCSRAFGHEQEGCPPELGQLSLEIVRMCQGFPLAIVAIADFLSRKEKTVLERKRLLDNFPLQLKSDPNMSKVLTLTFHNLPDQLNLCFLYFGIFPKGSVIPNEKLFRLWIAEGFVQAVRGKTLEEVAEEYLNELIQRNLVQAFEGFYGLEKCCRVHDVMHDMVRQKADQSSFCRIWDDKNSSFKGKSRRISISDNIEENVLETVEDSQVCSVFLSNTGTLSNSFVVTLFRKFKFLTLLDFENVLLDGLPEEVGNLFDLKYLSLKNSKLERLPKSVGKLQKLQTLDLRNTQLVVLPNEINLLRNLQHLLAGSYDNNINFDSTKGVRLRKGIRYLEKLQTIMTVEANLSGVGVIKELKKLRNLRRLCISRLNRKLASALCACIQEMKKLESLSLHSANGYEILNLQSILSAPPLLQCLVIKGRLQSFPYWISSLQNLSMLCLSLSRLSDNPLRDISDLPNLVCLWLYRAYDGVQLHFEVDRFQKLKLLVLRDLTGLEVVDIEEGALPLLEELRIGPCPLLNEVPSGIQNLRSLKVLAFYDMPNEFVSSMQPDGGSEYAKVEHVPSVLFLYRVQGRNYRSYALGGPELLDRLQGLVTNISDAVERDLRLSFSYSDDESNSASASTSVVPWNDMQIGFPQNRMSFSSDRFSFFSDDIED